MSSIFSRGIKAWALGLANSLLEKGLGPLIIRRFAKSIIRGEDRADQRSEELFKFFPHGDSGNRLLHRLFAEVLTMRGVTAEVVAGKPRWPEEWRNWRGDSDLLEEEKWFSSVEETIDFLESLAAGDGTLARGIIDEFVRWCPTDFFEGNYRVDANFLRKIDLDIFSAGRAVSSTSGAAIGESAYVYNKALVSATEQRDAPLWVFNTGGHWARADSKRDENFSDINFSDISKRLRLDPRLLATAQNYLEERFAGVSRLDFDSPNAFRGEPLPEHFRFKKVLALHAFRDANQLPIGGSGRGRESLFRTFYEWVDFVFAHISVSKDEWAIRPHPSSSMYRGDGRILESLLKKHDLQDIDRLEGFSTSAILENRLPVYTHNGTISAETAIFGYRSFVCANLYPEEITVFTRTKEELSAALALPFDDARPPIDPQITVDQMTVLLYDRFHLPLQQLRPPSPDNRSTPWRREKSSFFRITFYLSRFLMEKDKELIRSATDEIVEAVLGQQIND